MLQRIEPEERDPCDIFPRRVHAEDAASLAQVWEHAYLLP
jgi:hypothetical protein